jgi:hypothetical protein
MANVATVALLRLVSDALTTFNVTESEKPQYQGFPSPVGAFTRSVSIVVAMMSITGINNAAGEHSPGQHEQHNRDEFDTHDFLSSITVLIAICRSGRISAFLRPLMVFPAPMLHPALMLALARLTTVFPAAGAAPIAIPIRLLDADRRPDMWD